MVFLGYWHNLHKQSIKHSSINCLPKLLTKLLQVQSVSSLWYLHTEIGRASLIVLVHDSIKAPTNSQIFDYSLMNLLFNEGNRSQIFGGGASR